MSSPETFTKPSSIPWPARFDAADKDWISDGQRSAGIPRNQMWNTGAVVHVMSQAHQRQLSEFLES